MSALVAAKVLYEAGDLAGAKTQLQWAIDHGGDDYAPLARVRMAGVLLDEKAYDQGLALLKDEPAPYAAVRRPSWRSAGRPGQARGSAYRLSQRARQARQR
jgi:predicted negative regulator of RcsB-dependent stress response